MSTDDKKPYDRKNDPAARGARIIIENLANSENQTEKIIAKLVQRVENDQNEIGVLSMGERIAAAMVLDRPDLLPQGWTMLEAIERLGADWHQAALKVQKNGWR